MHKKNVVKMLLILSCFFTNSNFVFSQQKVSNLKFEPETSVELTNCHTNNSYLSILSQYLKPNEFIIIISHLGKSEKKSFGKRRMHNAKLFIPLVSISKNFTETIITAEGENVVGKGHLDFFVSGKFSLRIYFKKNQDLLVPPCTVNSPEEKPCSSDTEKLFFPCKKE